MSGTKVTFRPPKSPSQVLRVHSAPSETATSSSASRNPRRRAGGQAAERPCPPRRSRGPAPRPSGRVHHRQPGFPGLRGAVLLPARDTRDLFPAHRDAGAVDGEIHARFQRSGVDDLLPTGALRRRAGPQRPPPKRGRRGLQPGEVRHVPACRPGAPGGTVPAVG